MNPERVYRRLRFLWKNCKELCGPGCACADLVIEAVKVLVEQERKRR